MPMYDEIIATHEAGHAIAQLFYDLPFVKVTLDDPKGPHVEGEIYREPADPQSPTPGEMDWIARTAKATYAAQWAEKEAFGEGYRVGSRGDNDDVIQFSKHYVVDPEARIRWMSDQLFAARDDVKGLMVPIRALAAVLIQKRTMTYEEVRALYLATTVGPTV